MNERYRRLTAVGASALVLLTGCSRNNQEDLLCPKDSLGVAAKVGGESRNWTPVKGATQGLWNHDSDSPTLFTGSMIGKILVNVNDDVPEVLRPRQQVMAERAVYRCNRYDELNPPQPETYRQSLEAIQQLPKTSPEK